MSVLVLPMPTTSSLVDMGALRRAALLRAAHNVDLSLRRAAPPADGFLRSVRDVLIVASSSRSGSSLFAEMLKSSDAFVHCHGEINPFLHIAGLAWPESGSDSDALGADRLSVQAGEILERNLAAEVGFVGPEDAAAEADESFFESLYRRLCLQWPLEAFTIDQVRTAARGALRSVEERNRRKCNWSSDLALFHLLLLSQVRTRHPAVNPYYYDLDRSLIAALLPDLPTPCGPPSAVVIEEPPFVLIRPWTLATSADLARRALVIKTPSNAYRFGLLHRLFPCARMRILHLTRNPAAAINGLCDGWKHWGFHAHYVGQDLQIPGYSQPGLPDRGWWKFDLAPGWQSYRQAPLERICAFQWTAAQDAILDRVHGGDIASRRVRIEDVLGGLAKPSEELDELGGWLGDDRVLRRTVELPPIMSSQPPRPGRWRSSIHALDAVLRQRSVRSVAAELGYDDEATWH